MSDSARRRGSDRADAQRRANRIRAFRAELDALMSAGAVSLTAEQRESIARHHELLLQRLAAEHDVDRTVAAGQLSLGMQVASFFAAMALTAAVYSLVARFWGRLDLPLQATLLCAFPLAALAGVELAAQRERTLYISSIFALTAYGTYWLAIFVLGELLNVPIPAAALWGGTLFGLALALPYGFRVVLGVALVAFLLALSGSVFQAAGVPWTAAIEFPEPLTAAAFLLLIMAPRFGAIHRSFAGVTRAVAFSVGFLGLLLLSSAGPASLLPTPARVSELIYQGVILLASTTALTVGIRRRWRETVYLAAGALTVFLLGRFVDWFWDAVPRFVFFLLLAGTAFAWLLTLRRLRTRLVAGETP
ncbi:MAG TPA: hypothetical protein VMO26_22545 [Vicinamibacterales bacterium]|nr:hypothetical protein [Vicinamibacterales bacterium]